MFTLTVLGPKEAEMRIIGCDLHARQQALAMLDTTTGEMVAMTLKREGDNVREFYSKLPRPVRVGVEATGSMQWINELVLHDGQGDTRFRLQQTVRRSICLIKRGNRTSGFSDFRSRFAIFCVMCKEACGPPRRSCPGYNGACVEILRRRPSCPMRSCLATLA